MNNDRFNSTVAALAFTLAISLVGFAMAYPLVKGIVDAATANNMAMVALGALGAITAAGAGFFMRGKIQGSDTAQVTVPPSSTVTVEPGALPIPEKPVR